MTTKTIKIGDILEEKSYEKSSFLVIVGLDEKSGFINMFNVNNNNLLRYWNLKDIYDRLETQSFNSTSSLKYKIHSI